MSARRASEWIPGFLELGVTSKVQDSRPTRWRVELFFGLKVLLANYHLAPGGFAPAFLSRIE